MEMIAVERSKALPAWSLSLIVNVLLLLALSFLLARHVGEQAAVDDRRPVGIVLAQPTATDALRYLTDADVNADSIAAQGTATSATPAQSAVNIDEFATGLVPSELALPAAAPLALPGLATQETPRLSVSGTRPHLPGVDESAIIAAEQQRLRATQARGPQARIGLFGGEAAEGNSFVFLIDRSKSMSGGGLGVMDDVRDELVRVLQALDARHRFQVIVYHDKCVYLNQREMLPATDEHKNAVPDFLGTKAPFGATEHERALVSALHLEPDVIFLLTDGGDPVLADHQIRNLAKLAGGRTTIHCLHFGSGPLQDSDNFLSRLATATGGNYGYIDVSQRRAMP